MTTRAELLRDIARRFTQAGLDSPEREARALLKAALDLTDTDLIVRNDVPVPAEDAARTLTLAERR